MPSYEPDNEVVLSTRTTLAVLFIAGCFLSLGLLLYFYG